MNIKDTIKDVRFSFDKKESFSVNEVYRLLDDQKKAIIGATMPAIEDFMGNQKKVQDEQKAKLEELTKFKSETTKLVEEKESKIATYEKQLNVFNKEKQTKAAKDLFKGLVAKGAEEDAYFKLQDKIKEVDFGEITDINEKREKIKPIVNELVEAKPYLAFKEAKAVDKSLIEDGIKSKVESKKGEEITGRNYIGRHNLD